jgi:hypothetical protein
MACSKCNRSVRQTGDRRSNGLQCYGMFRFDVRSKVPERYAITFSSRYKVQQRYKTLHVYVIGTVSLCCCAMKPWSLTTSKKPYLRLVVFGSDAEQLIGSPVDVLLPNTNEDNTSIPPQIQALQGKAFEANPRCLDDGIICYQVNRLITVMPTRLNLPSQGTGYQAIVHVFCILLHISLPTTANILLQI